MLSATEKQHFRDCEAVLDEHYKSMMLAQLDPSIAIPSILAYHDRSALREMLVSIIQNGTNVDASLLNIEKYSEEGLSQALRWLTQSPTAGQKLDQAPSTNDCKRFLDWASSYVRIADFHRAYGRGMLSVQMESPTVVKFRYETDEKLRDAMRSVEVHSRSSTKLMKRSTANIGVETLPLLHRALSYSSSRVRIADFGILKEPIIVDAFRSLDPIPYVSIPESSPVADVCIASEFQRFFSVLRRWSMLLFIGATTSDGVPDTSIHRDQFIEVISKSASISREVADRITTFLTWDTRTKLPDLFQQPLFLINAEVVWSVSAVADSQDQRNMLRLLARDPKTKAVADNLVGNRSRTLADLIGKHFSKRAGYQYSIEKPIKTDKGEGEVDLLLYNTKVPEEILLVECKAILGADEINEVSSATDEINKGVEQLIRTTSLLMDMPTHLKQRIYPFVYWDRIKKTHLIVMTPDTEPGPGCTLKMPALSLKCLTHFFSDKQLASPSRVVERASRAPWLGKYKLSGISFRSYSVDNVTYKLPQISW